MSVKGFTGWHAVEIVKSAHHRANAGINCGFERREVNLAQRLFRHVGGVVVTATLSRAIRYPVLGASQDSARGTVILALKAKHARPSESRTEKRVLPGSLCDSLTRIARNVYHRRKLSAVPKHRLPAPRSCGTFGNGRISSGLAQRYGEDRAIAMDYVVAEQDRDLQT